MMPNPPFTRVEIRTDDSLMLSTEDVERLLKDDSSDSRSLILEKVAVHYNAKLLSEREQEVAEQIFRLLMRDISVRVRETLSQRVRHNPRVPRDIVLHMAYDQESVAIPVLEESPVLSDADLVSVVEISQDVGKLLAITRREHVSPRVSDALIGTQYTNVMTSLLRNSGARINDQSLQKIATDFTGTQDVIEALAQHPNLPLAVVERLISKASSAVAEALKEKYQVSEALVRQDASKVRDEFMLRLLDGDVSEEDIEALVARMAAEGTLTASIIMTALCRGQQNFFTVAMAQTANISLESTRRLLSDRGAHGFDGIYKKSGLPESMMDAVRLLLRAVQKLEQERVFPGSKLYANRLVERLVYEVGDRNIEYLPYIIALIRQNIQRK